MLYLRGTGVSFHPFLRDIVPRGRRRERDRGKGKEGEGNVPQPRPHPWHRGAQRKRKVPVPDHLGHAPREQHAAIRRAEPRRLRERVADAPDEEEPRGDLHGGREERGAHEACIERVSLRFYPAPSRATQHRWKVWQAMRGTPYPPLSPQRTTQDTKRNSPTKLCPTSATAPVCTTRVYHSSSPYVSPLSHAPRPSRKSTAAVRASTPNHSVAEMALYAMR